MFLAFFESIFLQIASRHIIWNMVIAHEDLSSCFLLPFITLKLEVVAIFVVANLWETAAASTDRYIIFSALKV